MKILFFQVKIVLQRYNISWNSLKDSIRKSSDSYVTVIKHMQISF